MKKLVISAAIIAGLISPAVASAAEVPQIPANTSSGSGVSTEPMKIVIVVLFNLASCFDFVALLFLNRCYLVIDLFFIKGGFASHKKTLLRSTNIRNNIRQSLTDYA